MTKEELDKLVTTEWTRLVPEGMYFEHELLLGMYWFRKDVKLGIEKQKQKSVEWIMRTPMYAKQPNQLVDEYRKAMKEE